MKNFAYLIAGVTAAIAYMLIQHGKSSEQGSKRASASSEPVEHLAHELQEAWADHHTQV